MRLIDADALLEKVEKIQPWDPYPSKYAQGIRHCMELVSLLIRDAPTIEPQRKTGRWELVSADKYIYRCDVCEKNTFGMSDYCPNCGADMREPEDIPMEYFESGGK